MISAISEVLSFYDIDRLGTFITLGDLEFDTFAFVESLKPIPLDRTIMNKHVATAFFFNEAVTFGIIKPLHLAGCHLQTSPRVRVLNPAADGIRVPARLGNAECHCQEKTSRRARAIPSRGEHESRAGQLIGISINLTATSVFLRVGAAIRPSYIN
jgi:hypothetical protein